MSRQHHILHFHLSRKKKITLFDRVVMVAAVLYPLSGIPQAFNVFKGNVDGVSVVSWLSFMAFSILFLVYGIVHKIKPMIVTNILWLFVDGLVVWGILLNTQN